MDDGTNNNQVTDLLSLGSYLELYQQYLPLYNSATLITTVMLHTCVTMLDVTNSYSTQGKHKPVFF